MNGDQIAGAWKEVSGKARARWGEITDDEWTQPAVFPALMWAVSLVVAFVAAICWSHGISVIFVPPSCALHRVTAPRPIWI